MRESHDPLHVYTTCVGSRPRMQEHCGLHRSKASCIPGYPGASAAPGKPSAALEAAPPVPCAGFDAIGLPDIPPTAAAFSLTVPPGGSWLSFEYGRLVARATAAQL
jgi:hypothetical protein